jgi:hypothetical protein
MRRLRSRVTLCRPSFALFTLQWHLSDPEEVLLTATRSKSCVMDDFQEPSLAQNGPKSSFSLIEMRWAAESLASRTVELGGDFRLQLQVLLLGNARRLVCGCAFETAPPFTHPL